MKYRPHPNFCVRCVRRGNCCDLDFGEMKATPIQGPYSYAVILVVCKDFKQRDR